MTEKQKQGRIKRLRVKRDKLWQEFCQLPRRSSFSGLAVSAELEKVQQELDELEGDNHSKRYYLEIDIEIVGY
ncbi:MAG: hypothetical protein WC517_03320 [Patescibacteria group bacterium]